MDLENIMLSDVSQAQKVKGHMLSFMWKLELYSKCTQKYIYELYIYISLYIKYIYRYGVFENEKYWNVGSVYEDNIMHCTVSCWIIGEQSDKE
jgi:hypothetical protein